MVALEIANQMKKQTSDHSDIIQSLTLLDGSQKFVELYTNTYRKVMKLSSPAEEEAMSLCAFLKKFIEFDQNEVSAVNSFCRRLLK